MGNYYIQYITDKSPNQYVFNLTGSASLSSVPLSLTGVNSTTNQPIRFLRLTSPAPLNSTTPRSSLINSQFNINLNNPADVFYVFRYLPPPDNSYTFTNGIYSIFTFLLSGYGNLNTGISEFIHYYYFNGTSGQLCHGFLSDIPGTTNNESIRFEALDTNNTILSNSFQTGKFVIFNWTYDGSKNFQNGGINSQTLRFNNKNIVLTSIFNSFSFEMSTGVISSNTQFGYTGINLNPAGYGNRQTMPNCLLGEIIFYNRILLTDERNFIFNYLSGKWGI